MKHETDLQSGSEQEQVILVHGTFASSAEDNGEAWWQIGSGPHNELKKRLPPHVSLSSEGGLFRWSGNNTERGRSKAASQLLQFVKPLEEAGTPYHLVGHSHGGSVIWAALRMATAKKSKLKRLRSWSTVGTPFLHHRSRSPWGIANVLYMVMAAALLIPAGRAFKALAKLPYDLAMGNLNEGLIVKPIEDVGIVSATIRLPILRGLELMGVESTKVESGLRLGSFDPTSGDSFASFLLGTFEGWLIIGAIVLFGYVTLLLGSIFLSSVSEGLRISWEKRLEQRAFDEYGQRWLGIWTQDDEAINGLRATMQLTMSFVGDLVIRERIFVSDLISLPWQPVYRLFAPLYNRMLRPLLDSKIREIVVKSAQGNDRPAAQVVAVSPHPILASPALSAPPVPDQLQLKIRNLADQHANELGPKLRVLLSQPSLTTGLEQLSSTLSGHELVHTSYFEHPEIIELLSMNISWSRGRSRPRHRSTSAVVTDWFHDFKRLQGAEDHHGPPSHRPQRSHEFGPHHAHDAA